MPTPPLPPGFQIEGAARSTSGSPPLPPGFEIEPPAQWERAILLPMETNHATGARRLAWPQIAVDVGNAITAPGRALQGDYGMDVDPQTGRVDPYSPMIPDALTAGMTFGGAAPTAPTLRAMMPQVRQGALNAAARNANVSRPAAEALARGIVSDDAMGAARDNLLRGGPNSMLAEAGPTLTSMLDTSIQRSGPAARLAINAVENRANMANGDITAALDQYLGRPQGVRMVETDLRLGSAQARGNAYDAAYASPIDYSTDAGFAIESLIRDRVPQEAIALANRMMRTQGEASSQMMAQVGDDGAVTFMRMPDVRQIDYITRALNQMAKSGEGVGAMGGQTDIGRIYANLARDLRDYTRTAVPAYDEALQTAAQPIQMREALQFGAELLSSRVPRDVASETIQGMTAPQLAYLRQGVRSQIDELLANVRMAASDPNIDARQAATAWRELSTPAARDKLFMILGNGGDAFDLFRRLDEAGRALNLRANVANNTRTYGRTAMDQSITQLVDSGFINAAAEGRPINALREVIQTITGRTPAAKLADKDMIYLDIIRALVRQGPEAVRTLEALQGAVRPGIDHVLPAPVLPMAETLREPGQALGVGVANIGRTILDQSR